MGSRGPAKKAVDLKLLSGPLRKRDKPPVLASALAAGEFDPTPPEHLGEAGRQFWGETLTGLRSMNALSAVDRPAIIAACEKADELEGHKATIATTGATYMHTNGSWVNHPACRLKKEAEKAIADFRRQFGLTPSARASMGIQPPKGLSSLQRFKLGIEEPMGIETRDRHAKYPRVVSQEEFDELVEAAFLGPEEGRKRAHALLSDCIDPRTNRRFGLLPKEAEHNELTERILNDPNLSADEQGDALLEANQDRYKADAS